MFIKKLGIFIVLLVLGACTGTQNPDGGEWARYAGTSVAATDAPAHLASGFTYEYDFLPAPYAVPGSFPDGNNIGTAPTSSAVAVILPLTGPDAALGRQIKHAIEIAFFQEQPGDIMVSFHDLSGTRDQKITTIENVIAQAPTMVIGPLFAEDAKLVRDLKPDALPVLSFTSDAAALGDGVLSVGLMPNQSVEAIVRRINQEGRRRVLFLAPENQSGYLNAASAVEAARTYGLDIVGLYYYRAGDTDAIKETAARATLNDYRVAANTRAKEILSTILIRETLCPADKTSLTRQLNALNAKDAIGDLPYDAVLFLGAAPDSKTLASFLRYYDLNPRKIKFFGTALWDSKILFNDITLAGSQYSSLPAGISEFNRIYRDIKGEEPERIASMGYDAAMLAINTLQSARNIPAYLLNPSGFAGLDGLIKLHADGTNERALEIMELAGTGSPRLKSPAVKNFMAPIYLAPLPRNAKPAGFDIGDSYNATDFITLPADLAGKYRSDSFGTRRSPAVTAIPNTPAPPTVIVLPEDDADILDSPDFNPITSGDVRRTNIDETVVYQ